MSRKPRHDVPDDLDDLPSKTQRKREMTALQALGEALAELPEQTLRGLPLEDRLLEALLDVKHITQRGAHKRQLQYIGKLMRAADSDLIDAACEKVLGGVQEPGRKLQPLADWRQRHT